MAVAGVACKEWRSSAKQSLDRDSFDDLGDFLNALGFPRNTVNAEGTNIKDGKHDDDGDDDDDENECDDDDGDDDDDGCDVSSM